MSVPNPLSLWTSQLLFSSSLSPPVDDLGRLGDISTSFITQLFLRSLGIKANTPKQHIFLHISKPLENLSQVTKQLNFVLSKSYQYNVRSIIDLKQTIKVILYQPFLNVCLVSKTWSQNCRHPLKELQPKCNV